MVRQMLPRIWRTGLVLLVQWAVSAQSTAQQLYAGAATADITPVFPVTLVGQFNTRVAHRAETPLMANVVALESRSGGVSSDLVIWVSCDMVVAPTTLIESVRREVARQLPGLDTGKIILNAIHTHTAPTFYDEDYVPPGIGKPSVYRKLFTDRVSAAIVKAWRGRGKATASWGLSTAVVGHNRRAVYKDGSAVMYGKTDGPAFQGYEGNEDGSVNTLFFWNAAGALIATSVDVACPAQEVELDTLVNADYWHEVRLGLKKRFGQDLVVVAWIGAAGDQSPHLLYQHAADERMRRLRGETRKQEIARRIVAAVGEAYDAVRGDRHGQLKLSHEVVKMPLPTRVVTDEEYEAARGRLEDAKVRLAANPAAAENVYLTLEWDGEVVARYEAQHAGRADQAFEVHVLRLGDIAVCSSQFELFTDFGLRIQARSKALQTFVIELAGPGSYLPTARAIAGRGYSAEVGENIVGPEGGQVLVDRTVEIIDQLWAEEK